MRIKQLLTIAALTCLSATAFAQNTSTPDSDGDCVADADCPAGFTCEIYETAIDCAPCPNDGTECPPCPSGGTYGYCSPPPPEQCNSDADCATDEVCVTYQYEQCSGSSGSGSTGNGSTDPVAPCEEGEDCGDRLPPEVDPEPVTCTSGSESYCVPQYIAPCQQDSDCGEGFSCNDIEICSCTVSGGQPVDSDGSTSTDDTPSVDPDEDCSCEPSGDKYCELNEVACDTDADCSGSLVCEDFGGGDIAVDIACDSDGVCDEPLPPEPVTNPSFCAPEGYGGWADAGVAGTDRLEAATGQNLSNESDSIQWGDDGRAGGSKATDDGCSSTNATPNWLTPALLLVGLFSLRRRRETEE